VPRSPTRARLRARRPSAVALLVVLAVASGATALPVKRAPSPPPRFTGEVTDTLRTPTHELTASPRSGRAAGDLLFADATHAKTAVRTCVARRDVKHVRTCFTIVTGAAGAATVTPLRFPRGRYVVHWSVAGAVVARWRFDVV
jgi:hypothetical protein